MTVIESYSKNSSPVTPASNRPRINTDCENTIVITNLFDAKRQLFSIFCASISKAKSEFVRL